MINLPPLQIRTYFDTLQNKNVSMKAITPESIRIFDGLESGFALRFCNDKRGGLFVEIGAGHWRNNNHTYCLEKEFDWTGLSLDINANLVDEYNACRKSICYQGDALNFNWEEVFQKNNFPNTIDFLSLDIDVNPLSANFYALINLPLSRYRFNTISIEHAANFGHPDLYKYRNLQREILFNYGYNLVVGGYVNDWWVNSEMGYSRNQYDGLQASLYLGEILI